MTKSESWNWPEWTEADMRLPAFKTCSDCEFLKRCVALLGDKIVQNRTCDWAPSRFQEGNK